PTWPGRPRAPCRRAAPATCQSSTGRAGCGQGRSPPPWPCGRCRIGTGSSRAVCPEAETFRHYSSSMSILLDRRCLHASGPDASEYLQSMVSNDIEKAVPGGGVYALLLTPKARLIADLEVFGVDGGYVIASDPAAADQVLATLLRARFRRKVEL